MIDGRPTLKTKWTDQQLTAYLCSFTEWSNRQSTKKLNRKIKKQGKEPRTKEKIRENQQRKKQTWSRKKKKGKADGKYK
jgi:hypothetical protein